MKYEKTIADIMTIFEEYLAWEQEFTFAGWGLVELYIADTLSEAWLTARPHDVQKFENKDFKRFVDSSNGKWLEKVSPTDTYKIILSTRYNNSISDLTQCFVHELRHCLDYQNTVGGWEFDKYVPGNEYYNSWSEFRATMADTRFEFFWKTKGIEETRGIFKALSELYGKKTADAIEGLMENQASETLLYNISRYLGADRAIKKLNDTMGVKAKCFYLWHLLPWYIEEQFGNVFYVANEWEMRKCCPLDGQPKEYYYDEMIQKIKEHGMKEC